MAKEGSIVVFRRYKVFSSRKVAIQKNAAEKKYWLVASDAKGALSICPLDEKWKTSGRFRPVTVSEIQKNLTPESGLFEKYVQPNLEQSPIYSYTDDKVLADTEGFNATEFRSKFEQVIMLMESGKNEESLKAINNLLRQINGQEEKHKYILNDCGISLRKKGFFRESIEFYNKAIECAWATEDENLHINLARALYDAKQYGGCVQHIFKALQIAPMMDVALRFLLFMERAGHIPKQYSLRARGVIAMRTKPAADADDVKGDAEKTKE